MPSTPRPPSLTERTIDAVREGIRDGTFVPGELYSVYQLADQLDVSRSPVREALLRLAETGMVSIVRNRGFRVVLPGARELAEIMAVRMALEIPAAAQAARRASAEDRAALETEREAMQQAVQDSDEGAFLLHDQRLHALLLNLAGNSHTIRIIENLRDATRLVGMSTMRKSRSLEEVYAEHLPILTAVEHGNATAAAESMRKHLESTGRLLLREAAGEDDDVDRLWAEYVTWSR
ncbi:DNA-binding GntR family transcriptional regulator [Arthrobacter pigmenti]|uniref:DNA-binding GntR family transcriptional regulator n=1 Tax=Arthrobacter pigmenti TaxID=271432 RepID=A0A846RK97_9MICC|nr:GntR family transcriptional regulator [Arthrobacter pigmenti]NJC23738.1 DNA-binding GntR family transcriptional regulator [Arthrobacter pigmenti]